MDNILFLILAFIFLSSTSANVIPIPKAENNLLEHESSNRNLPKNLEFIKDQTTLINSKPEVPEDGKQEIMHTAENIVFRPLFSYRQVKERRQRLHNTKKINKNANRRTSNIVSVTQTPVRYVYAYPYPSDYRSGNQDYSNYYYPSYNSGYYQ